MIKLKDILLEGLEDSWESDNKKVTLRQLLNITKNIPTQEIEISKLLPFVLHKNNPKEYDNIEKSDLRYPILIITNSNGSIRQIIDGHHRIQKAIKYKFSKINGKLIKFDDLPNDFKDILR